MDDDASAPLKAAIELDQVAQSIVDEWRRILTPQYVKQQIIRSQAKGIKRATLLMDDGRHDPSYLARLFTESGVAIETMQLLEPPARLVVWKETCFWVNVVWGSSRCIIL